MKCSHIVPDLPCVPCPDLLHVLCPVHSMRHALCVVQMLVVKTESKKPTLWDTAASPLQSASPSTPHPHPWARVHPCAVGVSNESVRMSAQGRPPHSPPVQFARPCLDHQATHEHGHT